MHKKAEKHSSQFLKQLMAERNRAQTTRVRNRMRLAAKISDAMKAKGWKKIDLANAMSKKPSVITKWLSGTHNFTSDTLTDIEIILSMKLLSLKLDEIVIRFETSLVQVLDEETKMAQHTEHPWNLYAVSAKLLNQSGFGQVIAKC